MWLWDPAPQLSDAAVRAGFFDFLARERVATVWAQVGTEQAASPAPPARSAGIGPARRLTHEAGWREFIGEAHRRNIRVEALDGDPTWALKASHQAPLDVVGAVLAYNRAESPGVRFDGIHFDIEPYLLIPWRFRLARAQMLREYLDLVVQCQMKVREFPGMQFGVDIPWWWQAIDDRTGRAIGDVLFDGTRKAASYHAIDRLDNVGIMNYRNFADGADGLISHGEDLLKYADAARRARIWMGVETSRSAPMLVWYVVGLPTEQMDRLLADPASGIGRDNRVDGFTVRLFDDGTNTHVGLNLGSDDPAHPAAVFLAALTRLARRFGIVSKPGFDEPGGVALRLALRTMAADREWQDPASKPLLDAQTGTEHPGFLGTSIMLPKLTFAGLAPDVMRRELATAEKTFSVHSSYGGIAIHHYESYVTLVGPARPGQNSGLAWPHPTVYGVMGRR